MQQVFETMRQSRHNFSWFFSAYPLFLAVFVFGAAAVFLFATLALAETEIEINGGPLSEQGQTILDQLIVSIKQNVEEKIKIEIEYEQEDGETEFDIEEGTLTPSEEDMLDALITEIELTAADVEIEIEIKNDPPVAVDQAINVIVGNSVNINLQATDANNDILTYEIEEGPEHGELGELDGASIIYTPDGSSKTDSFSFTASDGFEESDEATVNITIIFSTENIPALISLGVFRPAEGAIATSTPSLTLAQTVEIKVSTSTVVLAKDTVITTADGVNFNAALLSAATVDANSLSGLGSGTVINGALQWGIHNTTLQFSSPIAISIFVGTNLNGQTLNVMRSVSGTGEWTADGIVPPVTCVVGQGMCAFAATKASFYSAMSPAVSSGAISAAGGFSGGNESASASGVSGYSQSFAAPNESGRVNLSKNGSQIVMNIPPGAVSGNTLFSITSSPLETYSDPGSVSGLVKAGDLIFEIAAALGNTPVTSFLESLSIEFHYQENDILGLDENTLSIYFWDKTSGVWIALESRVDSENNMASASVNHLSVFGLLGYKLPEIQIIPPVSTSTPMETESPITRRTQLAPEKTEESRDFSVSKDKKIIKEVRDEKISEEKNEPEAKSNLFSSLGSFAKSAWSSVSIAFSGFYGKIFGR